MLGDQITSINVNRLDQFKMYGDIDHSVSNAAQDSRIILDLRSWLSGDAWLLLIDQIESISLALLKFDVTTSVTTHRLFKYCMLVEAM